MKKLFCAVLLLPAFCFAHDHTMHHASQPTSDADQTDHALGSVMPTMRFAKIMVDRAEYVYPQYGNGQGIIDTQAFYGDDDNKAWVKLEGNYTQKHWQELSLDALWSHALTPFWDMQLGVRHDEVASQKRTWLALGMQGLLPYWVDTDATLYWGENGRAAIKLEAEYDARITQKLILQPRVETMAYSKKDTQRQIASGFTHINLGLRLRYKVYKDFAPYIGVERMQHLGQSAKSIKKKGDAAGNWQWLAGFSFWY